MRRCMGAVIAEAGARASIRDGATTHRDPLDGNHPATSRSLTGPTRPVQDGPADPQEIDDEPLDQPSRRRPRRRPPPSSQSAAAPALACGGLIGPNGAVNLLRTTTLAGYHDGEEHYVTAFQFAGGGGAFGSLTPLPGVPSKVEKGGDWTLQRLVRETEPGPGGRSRSPPAPPATQAPRSS